MLTDDIKAFIRGTQAYREREHTRTRDFCGHLGLTSTRIAQVMAQMVADGELLKVDHAIWRRAENRKYLHMKWRSSTPPQIYGSPTWHKDNSGS